VQGLIECEWLQEPGTHPIRQLVCKLVNARDPYDLLCVVIALIRGGWVLAALHADSDYSASGTHWPWRQVLPSLPLIDPVRLVHGTAHRLDGSPHQDVILQHP